MVYIMPFFCHASLSDMDLNMKQAYCDLGDLFDVDALHSFTLNVLFEWSETVCHASLSDTDLDMKQAYCDLGDLFDVDALHHFRRLC